jgi:hypothetical protein
MEVNGGIQYEKYLEFCAPGSWWAIKCNGVSMSGDVGLTYDVFTAVF